MKSGHSLYFSQVGFILNKRKRKYDLPFCMHIVYFYFLQEKNAHFGTSDLLFIEAVLCCSFRRRNLGLGFEGAVKDVKSNVSVQPHQGPVWSCVPFFSYSAVAL